MCFSFLGKYISQFVSHFVTQGSVNNAILLNGFDYDRWKKTQRTGKVTGMSLDAFVCYKNFLPCRFHQNWRLWSN